MSQVFGWFPPEACILNPGRDVTGLSLQVVTDWQTRYPGVNAGVLLRIWDQRSVLSRSAAPNYEADNFVDSLFVVVAVKAHDITVVPHTPGTGFSVPCCTIQRVGDSRGNISRDESYYNHLEGLYCNENYCDGTDRSVLTLRHADLITCQNKGGDPVFAKEAHGSIITGYFGE
ncbi:hypothetical protein V8F06_014158 [Rhypophila decipiens]